MKALIDGVADAKRMPADDTRYVRSITFLPPEWGERDVVTLTFDYA